MKLKVAKRAAQQVDRIEQWWKKSRPSAPRTFTEELESTLRTISEMPGVGVIWPAARRPGVHRVLMAKTEHYVYFRVDETRATVHVLAVWGAPRGSGPKL